MRHLYGIFSYHVKGIALCGCFVQLSRSIWLRLLGDVDAALIKYNFEAKACHIEVFILNDSCVKKDGLL